MADGEHHSGPQEAFPHAAAILAEAGWRPHDGWGVYTRDTLVMGFQPDGLAFHVKNWAKVMPGDPQYSADTPDTAEEAAAWLVKRFKPKPPQPNMMSFASLDEPLAQRGEESVSRETITERSSLNVMGDTGEAHGEAGADAPLEAGDDLAADQVGDEPPEPSDESGASGSELADDVDALGRQEPEDATFWSEDLDAPALEHVEGADFPELGADIVAAEDEMEPQPEAGGSQFIFGDNLHQMRTAAIGLVVQHERLHRPPWTPDEDTFLIEERNFAMGVSEKRWPDDPARSSLLQALEATLAKVRAFEAARDAKVSFLLTASREEIEAFDPEADWPT